MAALVAAVGAIVAFLIVAIAWLQSLWSGNIVDSFLLGLATMLVAAAGVFMVGWFLLA